MITAKTQTISQSKITISYAEVLKKILLTLVVMIFTCTMKNTSAKCFFITGHASRVLTFTVPTRLSIPRNQENGVVYQTPPITVYGNHSFNCEGSSNIFGFKGLGEQSSIDLITYPLGDTGLGIRWVYKNINLTSYDRTTSIINGTGGWNGTQHSLQIVKIGPIKPGAEVPAGNIATAIIGDLNMIFMNTTNKISITEATCATPNIVVAMGDQKSSDFSGLNTRLTPKPFNLVLNNCPMGLASIKYRLDPTTSIIDMSNSVIALSVDSTASGVGVQILDSTDKPLPLNTDLALSTDLSAGGNFTIPLNAAYFQTSNTIRGGSANTSLTFTMSYQ